MQLTPEDLAKLGNPIELLQAAYLHFKWEAQKHMLEPHDIDVARAALEDAAQVSETIGVIQNGLNRKKFSQEILDSILKEDDA